ncbi:MAG: hypothetical protein JEZ04_01665 [Spirochaetales bacterium]|nr:hypothetical protein [Spirochaetales bacterium]
MELNTTVLDYSCFKKILAMNRGGNSILVDTFLGNFYLRYNSFKDAVFNNAHTSTKAFLVSSEACRLKDFIIETGGTRAAALLADYEKYASIADFFSCAQMEKMLFIEIETFKEAVVSTFA